MIKTTEYTEYTEEDKGMDSVYSVVIFSRYDCAE